jgi:predicted nucleotidyltransferase
VASVLPSQRQTILSVARKHRVTDVRVFGSVARGTANVESDIDLLVKFGKSMSLLGAIEFQQELQDKLGRKVDIIDESALSIYMRDRILNEARSL